MNPLAAEEDARTDSTRPSGRLIDRAVPWRPRRWAVLLLALLFMGGLITIADLDAQTDLGTQTPRPVKRRKARLLAGETASGTGWTNPGEGMELYIQRPRPRSAGGATSTSGAVMLETTRTVSNWVRESQAAAAPQKVTTESADREFRYDPARCPYCRVFRRRVRTCGFCGRAPGDEVAQEPVAEIRAGEGLDRDDGPVSMESATQIIREVHKKAERARAGGRERRSRSAAASTLRGDDRSRYLVDLDDLREEIREDGDEGVKDAQEELQTAIRILEERRRRRGVESPRLRHSIADREDERVSASARVRSARQRDAAGEQPVLKSRPDLDRKRLTPGMSRFMGMVDRYRDLLEAELEAEEKESEGEADELESIEDPPF